MKYQLGQSDVEQERLARQAILYNDAQYFALEPNMNVCEFGCGNGANLWVAQEIGLGSYIGIDIQQNQIIKARLRARELKLGNTLFYTADAANSSVQSNWADLSFCRLVLVHNPDPLLLLNEMNRVTKSGGEVLAIEPNNLSYIAYNKPYLNKTFHARIQYMYQPKQGTLDICPRLFDLFQRAKLSNIEIMQHSIYCDSRDPQTLKLFYKNWTDILDTMKDELIEKGIITQDDYNAAKNEADVINEGDCIYQSLWIARGIK